VVLFLVVGDLDPLGRLLGDRVGDLEVELAERRRLELDDDLVVAFASGPKPTRWRTTDFLSGKSSAEDFEIAAARRRSSSPRSISMPACGASTPSTRMLVMPVTVASLSRFLSVSRTPSGVLARLPKVYSCFRMSEGIFRNMPTPPGSGAALA
jgi:hypothetical protein